MAVLKRPQNNNILLIKPFNRFKYTLMPPIGLGYVSGALKRHGFKVTVFDASNEKLDIHQILDEVKPSVVGIYFSTSDYYEVINLVKVIKTYDLKVITIVGGPHISALPKKTMEDIPEIDFGFIGEGEIGLPILLEANNALNDIPGLVWRNESGVIINEVKRVQDLDDLGAPDWSVIDPRGYPNNPLGGFSRKSPVAYILTSRGCPFPCRFCAGKLTYGKEIRWRSINNVMEEIEVLITDFGIKEIHILDDNFALNKGHVHSFCNEVLQRKIKINFSCSNGIRLESLDLETLRLMKKAGFYSIAVGIESGSDKILGDMQKQTTTKKIEEKIIIAKKAGLEVTGLFIIGYPTETAADVMKTIDFAKILPLNRAAFTNFLPLPGSPIFQSLYENGDISDEDWKDYSYYYVKKSYAKAISKDELNRLLKTALLKYYLRPKQLLYIFRNVSSVNNLVQLFKRATTQLLNKN